MALVLEQTEALPSVSRGSGRSSEETNQLKEAVSGKTPIVIRGVDKSGFNALQQKIRYAAREVGMKVSIRRHNDSNPGSDTEGTVDVHFLGADKVDADEAKTTKASSKKS